MKVVHLTSVHPPTDIRIFYKECVTLATAGYDVTLVAPNAKTEQMHGVYFRSVPAQQRRLTRMLHTARNVVEVGLREEGDIYHLHDPELLMWAQPIRKLGVPLVFDMHENLPAALRSKQWLPGLTRRPAAAMAQLLERYFLRDLPVVFAEQSYQHHYPWISKQIVVQNFPRVDDLLAIDEIKEPIFSIGYVGRVNAPRGSLITLDALELLQRRGQKVGFHCIGPVAPEHDALLRDEAQRRNLRDVAFHDRLEPQAAWKIMARCHVGVALLQPLPNFVSSYPTKMFEYMALGIPVIVSDFPLYRQVISRYRCGIVVDPSDTRAIADAIAHLRENPDKARAMGARGRAAVQAHYSWKMEAEKLLGFYAHLLERRDG